MIRSTPPRMLRALLLTFGLFAGALRAEIAPLPELKPTQDEAAAAHLTAEVLSRFHYQPPPFNEALSEKIFNEYLKALDPDKTIFLASDVASLASHRRTLGDSLLKEDLRGPFAIFNLYRQRLNERYAHARRLLGTRFDFSADESYPLGRTREATWPASDAEMQDLWRKRVKNDWLRLRLAGEDEKRIAQVLDRRYDNAVKRVARIKESDAFQVFMNAYTMAIDPHTNYMGPRATQDFDISMRLSLVGIGAVLSELDGYTTIRELVAGGPAILSQQLTVGDRIVGVAQGANGAFTDVVGLSQDEVVGMIRGKEDTTVVLDILPAGAGPDAVHKRVVLVRKPIKLEEQAAKGAVRPVSAAAGARRVGVITLPSFYEDFAGRERGDKDYRSASRDVARLLQQMKSQGVDGVLIDLRNNGGGSLREAIALTGLFIDRGPVLQQRNADGQVNVLSDREAGVTWDGPLGVLINRGSASASEIFAAAIQDYGRGVVMGEPSFGKGTVQTVVDLDRVARSDKPRLGELRVTMAQFFRINGGTTQLRGVTPDIVFPVITDLESVGESSYDNALPWTQLPPARYTVLGDVRQALPEIQARHKARAANDPDYKSLADEVTELKRQRAAKVISLNEAQRRKERDAQLKRLAAREAANDPNGGAALVKALADDGLMPDERALASQLAAEKARKAAKDVLLDEAARIVGDQAELLRGARVVAGNGSGTSVGKPD